MTITHFLMMAMVSLVVTIPSVWFIPRARQSPVFDRVLWMATWTLAFLGAWLAPSYIPMDWSVNSFIIADVTLAPLVLGAVAGALSINGLLWLMDRFGGSSMDEDTTEEESNQNEEQDDGKNSNSDQPQ